MNKVIITMICIIVVLGAIITGVLISQPKDEQQNTVTQTQIGEEEILDDCTDEYEELENSNMLETNSSEEKISPNSSITYKTYYKGCGHTKEEYNNMPQELINCTKSEIEEKYTEWQVEKFASNEVVLYREVDGECGEHYLVKEKEGKLVVYKILENGEEQEYETTQISTDYLTDTDKIEIQNGIRVNGKQELNQLIEDYE